MKKKVIKSVVFTILTVLLTFGVYLYIGMILLPKDSQDLGGDKYYAATSYKYEEKNTVDVMMYGNSDLYASISPMEIYKNTGITAFGCGAGRQTMSSVVKQVRKTFKTQKPKLVVLEGDCFYYKNSSKGGSSKYESMLFKAPFKYHARWKELEGKDFIKAPVLKGKDNFMKGYVFSKEVYNYKLKDSFMKDVDSQARKLEKSVIKDFDKIYKMCKKNGAELMIMTAPTPITWTYAKHYGLQQLVDKYNKKDAKYQIQYVDYNTGLDGFDYSTYFYDKGNHCNYYGALVVTSAFTDFIQENYELTDRRGDDKYKSWDKCLAKYEKFIEKKIG